MGIRSQRSWVKNSGSRFIHVFCSHFTAPLTFGRAHRVLALLALVLAVRGRGLWHHDCSLSPEVLFLGGWVHNHLLRAVFAISQLWLLVQLSV